MILILSDKSDLHADRVESILQQNAAEYSRLNLDVDSIKSTRVRIEENSFRIETPHGSFSTSQIDVVWKSNTLHEQISETNTPEDVNKLKWNENWNKTLGGLFLSLESTKWLNFYQDFYGETQFRQFAISKNTGLKWPSYICSNDINYLNSFFETKKERLLDLMAQGCAKGSSVAYRMKCADQMGPILPDSNPELRGPLIDAAFQVRCSVVGKEYFVGKIKAKIDETGQLIGSNVIGNLEIHPPKLIKIRAIQIMSELNLTHGVFDFIVTRNGEWYFDALNPIGQYKWIEDINNSDISSSIAKWLMMNN